MRARPGDAANARATFAAMAPPPIPRRIAPLAWRGPAYIWTPLALLIALGGPFLALGAHGPMARASLIIGAFVYALALTTLALAWFLGRAPRSRREVALHVLSAGLVASVAAPFVLTMLLGGAARPGAEPYTLADTLALTPLALVIGLPILLLSALAFSLLALRRPPLEQSAAEDARFRVQPFR